jgi:hypothetical protein
VQNEPTDEIDRRLAHRDGLVQETLLDGRPEPVIALRRDSERSERAAKGEKGQRVSRV